ncbi:MAG TPA: lactate utilization protein C [Sneathiellales bacterium]|jgi:L-lactate dehydrogenase complex protein LldG|nr:lactate utilization protein C [Sneathiellales bacterium]
MTGDSRTRILETIARSLGRGPLPPEKAIELDRRLTVPRPNTVPARAQIPHAEQVDLFVEKAKASLATVERLANNQNIPAAVAGYLKAERLLSKVTHGLAPELAALPWSGQSDLQVKAGQVRDEGEAVVTGVFAAIAETGTLMITSGPEAPTGNVFLAETHIAVVHVDQVVGPIEDAWTKLRTAQASAATDLPRTVNLVTGPSRTGDIEAVMYVGAHGPRLLHILLIG